MAETRPGTFRKSQCWWKPEEWFVKNADGYVVAIFPTRPEARACALHRHEHTEQCSHDVAP